MIQINGSIVIVFLNFAMVGPLNKRLSRHVEILFSNLGSLLRGAQHSSLPHIHVRSVVKKRVRTPHDSAATPSE